MPIKARSKFSVQFSIDEDDILANHTKNIIIPELAWQYWNHAGMIMSNTEKIPPITIEVAIEDDAENKVTKIVNEQILKQHVNYKNKAGKYKFTGKINHCDENMNPRRVFSFIGCFLASIRYTNFDAATTELSFIVLKIKCDEMIISEIF